MSRSFGIVGLGNIGKVHARIFKQLGCELAAVLLSQEVSIDIASKYLHCKFGKIPKLTLEINEFLSQDLDFIVLASPVDTHYEYLVKCLDFKLPVFCEKPLIWDTSPTKLKHKIEKIKSCNGQFLVNTANTIFIDKIKERFPLENTSRFCFSFHTKGNHRGSLIAVDLLPHATALVTSAFGYGGKINDFKSYTSNNNYSASFNYEGRQIIFDFVESSSVPKKMTLEFDEKIFERQVSGTADSYKVRLIEIGKNLSFEIDDPFLIYAKKFLGQKFQMNADVKNLNLNAEIFFNG